eukprot:PhF_6_TR33682/c0_g1_i5/m.49354
MYQSLVQCLVRVFPKTVPSVMCLSQQSDSTDNDIPSFICPFDIILTAMDLFRPEFDVANADKKDTINDEFRWPLGMAMYDDRYLCVADLDAKSLFIVDSMDETFPIVHTVRTVGAGWVAASRSGRVVISGKEECELKIYQIVSKEPWQFDIVRTISFKEDPNGIVFLLDDVQLAVCVQKTQQVRIVDTDTGDTSRNITSPLFLNPCGICLHPTRRDHVIVSNFLGHSCVVVNVVTCETVQKIDVTGYGDGPNGIAIVSNDMFALCFMTSNKISIFSGWNVEVSETEPEVLTETTVNEERGIDISCIRVLCHGSRLYVSDGPSASITVFE